MAEPKLVTMDAGYIGCRDQVQVTYGRICTCGEYPCPNMEGENVPA